MIPDHLRPPSHLLAHLLCSVSTSLVHVSLFLPPRLPRLFSSSLPSSSSPGCADWLLAAIDQTASAAGHVYNSANNRTWIRIGNRRADPRRISLGPVFFRRRDDNSPFVCCYNGNRPWFRWYSPSRIQNRCCTYAYEQLGISGIVPVLKRIKATLKARELDTLYYPEYFQEYPTQYRASFLRFSSVTSPYSLPLV